MIFLILFVVAVLLVCAYILKPQPKKIAIAQFDERDFDPQIEKKLLEIADWYEFQNITDADFEIQDLKNHYKIVLEVK